MEFLMVHFIPSSILVTCKACILFFCRGRKGFSIVKQDGSCRINLFHLHVPGPKVNMRGE